MARNDGKIRKKGEINMEAIIAIVAIVAALAWPLAIILIVIVLKREWNKQNREK